MPSFPDSLRRSGEYIAAVQMPNGGIPWFEGGVIDPWDHVEAAMGLSIAGYWREAERGYAWLARQQQADGGWWAAYDDDRAVDTSRRESNFVAYVATGVWQHYLITADDAFLAQMWPAVEAAMDFVCAMQRPQGDIAWALDSSGRAADESLLTGCSSIYKSLECALNIAAIMRRPKPKWRWVRARLGEALRHHPALFDPAKRRYSMDWFYPVLGGVLGGEAGRARLAWHWREFVKPGLGCLCVADRPWVTVAESCELTIALLAADQPGLALRLFGWLSQFRDECGAYWTGYVYADHKLWPVERPTWTAGAVLLAADALYGLTPAAGLFTGASQMNAPGKAQTAHAL